MNHYHSRTGDGAGSMAGHLDDAVHRWPAVPTGAIVGVHSVRGDYLNEGSLRDVMFAGDTTRADEVANAVVVQVVGKGHVIRDPVLKAVPGGYANICPSSDVQGDSVVFVQRLAH